MSFREESQLHEVRKTLVAGIGQRAEESRTAVKQVENILSGFLNNNGNFESGHDMNEDPSLL